MAYPKQGICFETVAGQAVLLVDSVTWLDYQARDQIVVTGSHGGVYSAFTGATHGPKAILFNDAGIGKDSAGVAGLKVLDHCGVPAAAIDCWSARIGDAGDTLASGIISESNEFALRCGVRPGDAASDAVRMFVATKMMPPTGTPLPPPTEKAARYEMGVEVYVLDSASLIEPAMSTGIVVTGSHGGVIGGGTLKHYVRAAFFNDAGIGKEGAGIGRLVALDRQDIPAAVVDYRSARIGDGLDAFQHGLVSRSNSAAARMGVRSGNTVADACALLAAALQSEMTITPGERS